MKPLSSSPERGTFSFQNTKKRLEVDPGNTDLADRLTELQKMWEDHRQQKMLQEQDPEWQKNNLEYQLRSTDWIVQKVKSCNYYAQNLYAAMCNTDFVRSDLDNTAENITQVLTDGVPKWSCSWRYAGGIIADMCGQGDYIDWYCSGIRDRDTNEQTVNGRVYVGEGMVTDEIRADILQLGWRIITYE